MGALPKRLQGQTPSHARSRVQEKETAERTGGEQTPRSGAGRIKGDVRVRGVARVEDKTTKHASFSVTTKHLEKLDAAVAGSTEIPIMKIELVSGAYEFIVIPGIYFEDIINALKNDGQ
jgi:hypothetical protein